MKQIDNYKFRIKFKKGKETITKTKTSSPRKSPTVGRRTTRGGRERQNGGWGGPRRGITRKQKLLHGLLLKPEERRGLGRQGGAPMIIFLPSPFFPARHKKKSDFFSIGQTDREKDEKRCESWNNKREKGRRMGREKERERGEGRYRENREMQDN